jgi:hypothetical protein
LVIILLLLLLVLFLFIMSSLISSVTSNIVITITVIIICVCIVILLNYIPMFILYSVFTQKYFQLCSEAQDSKYVTRLWRLLHFCVSLHMWKSFYLCVSSFFGTVFSTAVFWGQRLSFPRDKTVILQFLMITSLIKIWMINDPDLNASIPGINLIYNPPWKQFRFLSRFTAIKVPVAIRTSTHLAVLKKCCWPKAPVCRQDV